MILTYILMKTQMTNIEPEIIWSTKTPKGQEKIETISPEVIEVPNYDYWDSQNTLDANVALRNFGWANSKAWYEVTTWIAAWNDVVVTWVWFKPKTIIVNANVSMSGHNVISNWSATDWEYWNCIFAHDNNNVILSWTSYETVKIATLQWQSSWPTYHDIRVRLKSMDSDWFTLTVTTNSQTDNFNFNYTCF